MTSFREPMSIVLAIKHALLDQHQAKQLARLARETGGNLALEHDQRRFEFPDPADLRGIPIQGAGIGGAIRGTRPGDSLRDL